MNYYIRWREWFNDYDRWCTKTQVQEIVDRLSGIDGWGTGVADGEATIYEIIEGESIRYKFGVN